MKQKQKTVCDVKQLTNSQTSTTVIVTEQHTEPTQSWLFLHTLLVFLHTPCQFSVKWVSQVNDLPCQTAALFPKDHHSIQKLQSLSTSSLLQFSNSYHRLIVSDSFWFFLLYLSHFCSVSDKSKITWKEKKDMRINANAHPHPLIHAM